MIDFTPHTVSSCSLPVGNTFTTKTPANAFVKVHTGKTPSVRIVVFRALLLWIATSLLVACNNFEDASPTERTSLMRFYSSNQNMEGTLAEPDTDGGYIIAGNVIFSESDKDIIIIKTDALGNKIWEKIFEDGKVNSLNIFDQGYLLAGSRIEINVNNPEASEQINTQSRIIIMNRDGVVGTNGEIIFSDSVQAGSKKLHVDFEAHDVVLDDAGHLIILSSRKAPESFRKSILVAFNPASATPTVPIWIQDDYFLTNRNYVNCNSLQITNSGNLLWAANVLEEESESSAAGEGVSLGFVPPNATFNNADKLGENDDRNHIANDLQPSTTGYGLIGTYLQSDKNLKNMFFIKVDRAGNFIDNSILYFDLGSIAQDRNVSQRDDEGNALTGTFDGGFVLAGTITTNNGDTDIVLIKLDAFGKQLWTRTFGGSGDETVSSVREASDYGLVLCGTNTVKGQSSIMLIKTDSKGELKN
jgi:hypothetical protein